MSGSIIKKGDIAVISAGILLSALLFAASIIPTKSGSAVEISLGGEAVEVLPLDEDRTFEVGGALTVVIKNGEASVSGAVCRGKLCEKHRPISRAGEVIVCAPGGVVIRVLGEGPDFVL